ncbi:hypothetical protein K438DRAFT_1782438 [Mycena galopus ATCC 62051]|nr:hypothetical protein K438DRAFT_1782438 [Mycena galopus ATCC 62051]
MGLLVYDGDPSDEETLNDFSTRWGSVWHHSHSDTVTRHQTHFPVYLHQCRCDSVRNLRDEYITVSRYSSRLVYVDLLVNLAESRQSLDALLLRLLDYCASPTPGSEKHVAIHDAERYAAAIRGLVAPPDRASAAANSSNCANTFLIRTQPDTASAFDFLLAILGPPSHLAPAAPPRQTQRERALSLEWPEGLIAPRRMFFRRAWAKSLGRRRSPLASTWELSRRRGGALRAGAMLPALLPFVRISVTFCVIDHTDARDATFLRAEALEPARVFPTGTAAAGGHAVWIGRAATSAHPTRLAVPECGLSRGQAPLQHFISVLIIFRVVLSSSSAHFRNQLAIYDVSNHLMLQLMSCRLSVWRPDTLRVSYCVGHPRYGAVSGLLTRPVSVDLTLSRPRVGAPDTAPDTSSGRSRVSHKDFAPDTGNVGTADPASDMIRVRLKYMLSLRATTKKKPAVSTKKKGKMAIMDLNNADSAGEDDEDEGIADGEKKAMAELDAEYRKCMRCGSAYVCKIDRSGQHVHLSFNQRCAWAVSLACGTNNVTKTTPPQGDLFVMFHRKAKEGPTPGPAGPPAQYNPYFPYPMPPLFPQYHQHGPPTPQLPSGPAIHPQLSSDPPEENVSYPSIIDFVAMLIQAVPQRAQLRTVGETLDSLHFYQIDEIISLTVDDLGTERFGFVVPGDATYLLERARKEVKWLDKLARRARRS